MKQIIPFSKEIVFKTNIASITSISLEHEEKIFDGEVSGDFIIFGDYKIHNDTTEKELFKYRLPFTTLIPDNIIADSILIDVENFTYEQIEDDVLRINIDFSIEGEERTEILEVYDRNNENNGEISKKIDNDFEDENNESVSEVQEDELEMEILNEVKKAEDSSETEILYEENVSDDLSDNNDRVINYDNTNLYSLEEISVTDMDKDIEFQGIEFNKNTDIMTNEKVLSNDEVLETNKDEVKERDEEIVKKVHKEEMVDNEYVTYHIHIVKNDETLDNILSIYGSSLDVVSEYNDVSNIKALDKVIIPEYLDE